VDTEAARTLGQLSEELQKLGRTAMELRESQKSVQGMISEVTGMCIELINRVAADQIEAEILYLLVRANELRGAGRQAEHPRRGDEGRAGEAHEKGPGDVQYRIMEHQMTEVTI